MYTDKDIKYFAERGISTEEIDRQLNFYKSGFPFLELVRPATAEDGIRCLSEEEITKYVQKYNADSEHIDIVKFVPASGAASRMFKDLFVFVSEYNNTPEQKQKFNDLSSPARRFIDNIDRFAFYDNLQKIVYGKYGMSVKEMLQAHKPKELVESVILKDGLNYGSLPKGLIEFHRYKNTSRTPVEEHIAEGIQYAKSGKNVKIHFTVSPEHLGFFTAFVDKARISFEEKYNCNLEISFSTQKAFTDTISVDDNNEIFRNEDGSPLFRPAGHGSLIENLNDINARLVFIKTIDNVVPDSRKEITIRYKEALAGYLLKTKENIADYIKLLENNPTTQQLDEAYVFISKKLCTEFPESFLSLSDKEKAEKLLAKLKRPLRVCGMVKNEGEPGGGPFWAKNQDGTTSLQIVESSQIDSNNPDSMEKVKKATHFNPVDLVCDLTDCEGNKYDLRKFTDPLTGFISHKSKNGRNLKSIERPGLWNGAMSDWNTVFVEVPIETFSPVKTILDLLREQHQN
ncbi:MAG: DUF4301 family protein [Bacteroidales bacterium]|nr:DUF4301 family protein [Bacteroidales bacterium]